MAAAVQQLSTARYTNLDRNCGSHELAALGPQKSPHDQLCEVLVQLRNLTLDPYQDVYRSHSSTSLNEHRDVSSTLREHGTESSGPALAQYESQTPAPAELVQIHNAEIKPMLDALLFKSDGESTTGHDNHVLTEKEIQLDFLKLVAYGATNNFAGMDNPAWRAMTFRSLKTVLSPVMQSQAQDLSLWKNISLLQALKPMVETYFRCAVEGGDHDAVAQLLSWSEVDIDVNSIVCTVDDQSLTPVEVAASLRNTYLVRTLIGHGADVNKALCLGMPIGCKCSLRYGGALYYACSRLRAALWASMNEISGPRNIDFELVSLILGAGGLICSMALREITRDGGATLVQLFLNRPIPKNCRNLLEAGVLHEALYQLQPTEQRRLLVGMRDADMSLKYAYDYYEHKALDAEPLFPAHFIDIAARRGQLKTVQLLRSWDVPFTESTLVAGIRSSDTPLPQLLLDQGAPTDCFSREYMTTPLAEAVCLQNPNLIDQLSGMLQCATQLTCKDALCTLLAAAAEAGDETLVDQLLAAECDQIEREKILGYGLTRACKSNHLSVARKLLDSGASTARSYYTNVMGFGGSEDPGRSPSCPCPLASAIRNRNEEMLELLLDHDVGPSELHYWSMEDVAPAVEWGSLQVFQVLLSAGVITVDEECLIATVQQRNIPLLSFLLSQPSPVRRSYRYRQNVLRTAVQSKDEIMLRMLLDSKHRIDPSSEPEAFAEALHCSPNLYQLLLDKALTLGMASDNTMRDSTSLSDLVWSAALNQRRVDIIHWLASEIRDSESVYPKKPLLASAIEREEHDLLAFIMSLGISPNTIVSDANPLESPSMRRLPDGSRVPCHLILNLAIKCKKTTMVEALLTHGADINFPAKYGIKRTPLQQAAETGYLTMIELLLTAGANIKAPPATRNGGTPIQLAATQGFIGVVQYLEKRGDDFWAPGSKVGGRTALEGAAEHGRFDMVHYLASRRPPDLDQYDKAKQFALKNGHGAIADMLEAMFQARKAEAQPIVPRLPGSSSIVRRRHICSTCSASFTKASALRRHERGHQDTYAYRCLECEKGFRRKDTLDRHVDTQHVGVSHQCHVCGDEFSRQDTLSQHMRTKHREAGQVATASTASPIASWA